MRHDFAAALILAAATASRRRPPRRGGGRRRAAREREARATIVKAAVVRQASGCSRTVMRPGRRSAAAGDRAGRVRVKQASSGFQPISANSAERGTSVTASFTVTLSPGARLRLGGCSFPAVDDAVARIAQHDQDRRDVLRRAADIGDRAAGAEKLGAVGELAALLLVGGEVELQVGLPDRERRAADRDPVGQAPVRDRGDRAGGEHREDRRRPGPQLERVAAAAKRRRGFELRGAGGLGRGVRRLLERRRSDDSSASGGGALGLAGRRRSDEAGRFGPACGLGSRVRAPARARAAEAERPEEAATAAGSGGSWNQLCRHLAQRTVRPSGPIALSGTT